MAGESRSTLRQNLILEDRKRLSVSGVEEVEGFDETYVTVHTTQGELFVRGEGLHVESLSVETGDLLVSGEISGLFYEEKTERRSLWGRLFG